MYLKQAKGISSSGWERLPTLASLFLLFQDVEKGSFMPLSGGPADKVGNRYESGWTVSFLIEILLKLMDEELLTIRLEPPGENPGLVNYC